MMAHIVAVPARLLLHPAERIKFRLCLFQLCRHQIPFPLCGFFLLRFGVIDENKHKVEHGNYGGNKLYRHPGTAVQPVGVDGGNIIKQVIQERHSAEQQAGFP